MHPVFQSVDPCFSEMCDAFAVLANPRWKRCCQENTNVNTVGCLKPQHCKYIMTKNLASTHVCLLIHMVLTGGPQLFSVLKEITTENLFVFWHWIGNVLSINVSVTHCSVRRGYQVYKQVCSACHSMEYLAFRNLVGVSHTEAEVKAIAEEVRVKK